mmetsp:Transcript_30651/g.70270  ORF Transcript_30651/g.70270 Transcript_30651/m.70270 type:complete len:280 (-) Transcript_30651:21-860(-)
MERAVAARSDGRISGAVRDQSTLSKARVYKEHPDLFIVCPCSVAEVLEKRFGTRQPCAGNFSPYGVGETATQTTLKRLASCMLCPLSGDFRGKSGDHVECVARFAFNNHSLARLEGFADHLVAEKLQLAEVECFEQLHLRQNLNDVRVSTSFLRLSKADAIQRPQCSVHHARDGRGSRFPIQQSQFAKAWQFMVPLYLVKVFPIAILVHDELAAGDHVEKVTLISLVENYFPGHAIDLFHAIDQLCECIRWQVFEQKVVLHGRVHLTIRGLFRPGCGGG